MKIKIIKYCFYSNDPTVKIFKKEIKNGKKGGFRWFGGGYKGLQGQKGGF